jgi:succinyl-CoA synthetase alpha subunit
MSILIDKNTKVITQGITGKTGQFHTRMCRDYANGKDCYVAGVTPGKGGQDFDGIPIYNSVHDAKAATGVVTAARQVGLKVPLVVRLEGTNVELGKKILADSGLPIISGADMADAAQKVVAAAKGKK